MDGSQTLCGPVCTVRWVHLRGWVWSSRGAGEPGRMEPGKGSACQAWCAMCFLRLSVSEESRLPHQLCVPSLLTTLGLSVPHTPDWRSRLSWNLTLMSCELLILMPFLSPVWLQLDTCLSSFRVWGRWGPLPAGTQCEDECEGQSVYVQCCFCNVI